MAAAMTIEIFARCALVAMPFAIVRRAGVRRNESPVASLGGINPWGLGCDNRAGARLTRPRIKPRGRWHWEACLNKRDLVIEYRPVDSLVAYVRNARTHSDAQI